MDLSRRKGYIRTAVALAVVTAAAAAAGHASPAVATPAPKPTTATAPQGTAGGQVTLLTGDRVTVQPDGEVRVTPASGRAGMGFTTHRDARGHLHVIPLDAVVSLGNGSVDPELFDVTALAAYGFGARGGSLPLIVRRTTGRVTAGRGAGREGSAGPAAAILAKGGAKIVQDLPVLDGTAVSVRPANGRRLWTSLTTGSKGSRRLRPGVATVRLDRPLHPVLDQTIPMIGAPMAWAAGYDGTGVTVAVLDSGIDITHPDLAGKVDGAMNFTAEPGTGDLVGHGTHVASIVAGTGAAANQQYRGVAPGARLLNAKVCYRDGTRATCPTSSVVAGMMWATSLGAKVINMSLSGTDTQGIDDLEAAVNQLSADTGALFVTAAGNEGEYGLSTVGSPASADAALAVGAVDHDGALAPFSSRGPRRGDYAVKPEITAPGVAVQAARSSTGIMGSSGQYVGASGTSMATPHVAGAAAILAQRNPTWRAPRLKAALMASAAPAAGQSAFDQGAGRLSVADAYTQAVLANPPAVSLGRQAWPHGDDPVLTRTVTVTNTGDNGMGLYLSLRTLGPDGAAAPAGMFAISPTELNLPPGASAAVTLTATTSVSAADGYYTGHVVGTGAAGGIRLSVPFGVDRSVEEYSVTVEHINRTSATDTGHVTRLTALNPQNPSYQLMGFNNTGTMVVAPGDYLAESLTVENDGTGWKATMMVNPRLRVTGDQTLTFDARTAGAVTGDITDDNLERQFNANLTFQFTVNGQIVTSSSITTGMDHQVFMGQTDPNQWEPGFLAMAKVLLGRLGPAGDARNSPRSYHLVSFLPQHVPTGWSPAYSTSQLARIDSTLNPDLPGATLQHWWQASPGFEQWSPATALLLESDVPATHSAYVTTDGGVRWTPGVAELVDAGAIQVASWRGRTTSYQAGSTSTESWNQAVFGPAMGMPGQPAEWAIRQGNTIKMRDLPLFGDGAGHSGWAGGVNGHLTLSREGTVVASGTNPWGVEANVPGGYSAYRLEVDATRSLPGLDLLSSRVRADWTFHSDTPGGDTPLRLPLWSVSFLPTVSATGTAPAGTTFTFPATVAVQPGATAAGLRSLTVRYSTDDGATWADATVTRNGLSATVQVTHPNLTGTVSLRATAVDDAGNSVTETITRAYRIAG